MKRMKLQEAIKGLVNSLPPPLTPHPHTLCSVCELVYLLAVVYTGRSNLSFPARAHVCVSVRVVLCSFKTQLVGAGASRWLRHVHAAGPSNTPLCGPKLKPSSAFSKQTKASPAFVQRGTHADILRSQWKTPTRSHTLAPWRPHNQTVEFIM